jgi:flagellar biosynthesis regulator FlbT
MIDLIGRISENILVEKYYDALKLTRELIEYEQKLISHAKEST